MYTYVYTYAHTYLHREWMPIDIPFISARKLFLKLNFKPSVTLSLLFYIRYAGQFRDLDVQYSSPHGIVRTRHVGGSIEPYAFTLYVENHFVHTNNLFTLLYSYILYKLVYHRRGGSAATSTLRSGQSSAILQVPTSDQVKALDLAHAAGASSYAPG